MVLVSATRLLAPLPISLMLPRQGG